MSMDQDKPRSIKLDVVSPEESLLSTEVSSIVASGFEGELGIMPGHSAFLSPLKPGPIVATLFETG
jgi:F-type H+-transporting ATPase subunit epsilon